MLKTDESTLSIDAVLSMMAVNLKAPKQAEKPTDVSPIDESLAKYRWATDYYLKPQMDAELLASYQRSLLVCERLKEAFDLSASLTTDLQKSRNRSLSPLERDQRQAELMQQKIMVLENIRNARAELQQLKIQRSELRKGKKTLH